MKREVLINKGFTLVEMMVVIAIISIMATGVVVGLGPVTDYVRLQQTVGVVEDLIHAEDLKIQRGDTLQAEVHFLTDYLVIEESTTDTGLSLTPGPCPGGYGATMGSDGNLITRTGEGVFMEMIPVTSGDTKCVKDFGSSGDTEWNYQLTQDGQVSPLVRFVHFNPDYENPANAVQINTSGSNADTLVLKAPYLQKMIYSGGNLIQGEAHISLKNQNGNKAILTLRP